MDTGSNGVKAVIGSVVIGPGGDTYGGLDVGIINVGEGERGGGRRVGRLRRKDNVAC